MSTPQETEVAQIVAAGTPDEKRNQTRAQYFLSLVEAFTVDTKEDYEVGTAELRKLKEAATAMENDRVSFTKPLNDLLRKFNARFKPALTVLEDAELILKRKLVAWSDAEAARIRAEREEAERKVRLERERLEREAEEIRLKAEAEQREAEAAERKRQEEALAEQRRLDQLAATARSAKARKEAAEAAAAQRVKDEAAAEEARQKQAEAAQQAEQQAQALEQTAAVVIAQPANAQVTRVAGISTSKTVDFEVIDQLALVKHIANERPDLVVLLTVDSVKLRALVKMHGLATKVPGVRVFEKSGMTVR